VSEKKTQKLKQNVFVRNACLMMTKRGLFTKKQNKTKKRVHARAKDLAFKSVKRIYLKLTNKCKFYGGND